MTSCVFCGQTNVKMSKEHVFGDWISRYFIEELGVDLKGVAEMVDVDGQITQFPTTPFQQKVRIVCKPCNEGWMSKLENDVMEMLKLMMIGKPVMLRSNAKKHLAFWCAKTALVLDHLHPQHRIVPEAHYRELFERKRALSNQVILVAYRSVPTEAAGQLLGSALKQPVLNVQVPSESFASMAGEVQKHAADGHQMYKITFAVGNFATLVFGHDFPMSVSVNSPRPIAKHIWPINQRFEWSSDLSVDQIGGLPAFHASFAPNRTQTLPDNIPGRVDTDTSA